MEIEYQGILTWYGHILLGRDKPNWRWPDEVKNLLLGKDISMDEGIRLIQDMVTWRRKVFEKFC